MRRFPNRSIYDDEGIENAVENSLFNDFVIFLSRESHTQKHN